MVPTREHWRIQKWANEAGATPAEIRPRKFDGEATTLTFLFGEAKEASPDIFPISWEMFFAQFDVLDLSVAFDECTATLDIVKVSQDPGRDLIH